ncbi:MAG: nucleoside-triphosphatase [Bacteroidota bacterium]
MKPIYILPGKIHTGKTTRLMQWAVTQKNIDGIFQPVINDKRFIYHLASRTLKLLETDQKENIISIGKFNFSNAAFEWAKNTLLNCFKQDLDWLVIDEIGPLELDDKGLEPVITKIISEREKFKGKTICVVRDTILEKFLSKYDLKNHYEIFTVAQI